jgi:hypothetical protein
MGLSFGGTGFLEAQAGVADIEVYQGHDKEGNGFHKAQC